MISHPTPQRKTSRGFTLLEMMVNLAIVSFLLVAVAATAAWSSEAVAKTQGRIAAMEKSTELQQSLATDLARVLPDDSEALKCTANSESWSLTLRLPSRERGYETVKYLWSRDKQTVHRRSDFSGNAKPELIATGITRLASDWRDTLSTLETDGSAKNSAWEEEHAPAFLSLHLQTTRAPSLSPSAGTSPVKPAISRTTTLFPVGASHSSAQ